MPFWGQNQCFLGLGGQFKAPHPISQVLNSKKHVFQHMGAGNSVHQRPQKQWPFAAQKWLKNVNFGPRTVFFGLGSSILDPSPYSAGAQPKTRCVPRYGTRKNSCFKANPPFPQKCLKMPILGQEQFLGSGGPFKAPPPYLAGV